LRLGGAFAQNSYVEYDGESLGDMLIEASGDGQRIEGESTLSLYFILGELDGTCNFFY